MLENPFEKFDVILKDEGDYIAVIFQNEKALQIAQSYFNVAIEKHGDVSSINIVVESKDYVKEWLGKKNLTFTTF